MRIGVTFPQIEFGNDPVAIRDYAQTVEGLGYTHFLAYDHVLGADASVRPGWTGPYASENPFHEVFVLLGYLAGLTSDAGAGDRGADPAATADGPRRQAGGRDRRPQRRAAATRCRRRLERGRVRGAGQGLRQPGSAQRGADRAPARPLDLAGDHLRWAMGAGSTPPGSIRSRCSDRSRSGSAAMPRRPCAGWDSMGDGWFPWREPNETMRAAIERIHSYASEAGRDPSAIGLEPQLNVGRGHTRRVAQPSSRAGATWAPPTSASARWATASPARRSTLPR